MTNNTILQNNIEKILTKLKYFDLEFFGYDSFSNTFSYNGYIDTAYRIHIIMNGTEEMEVWDCTFDKENFVKICRAKLLSGKWEIIGE